LTRVAGLFAAFCVIAGAQVREGTPRVPEPRALLAVPHPTLADLALQESGIANFRGLALPYVVVEGMAVHAGDMVLGRAADLEIAPAKLDASPPLGTPTPRHLAHIDDAFLWPSGIVPYVIDAEVSPEQVDMIREAIQEWNEKTVISLQARAAQANYARFTPTNSGSCRAKVGMVGGEQGIYIPAGGCSVATLIHEIGHTVGLYHEHQRQDRDAHVTVLDENINQSRRHSYSARHPGVGPYDYASTMHYSTRSTDSRNGRPIMETIPPGLHIPSSGLSQGDIVSVARLYQTNPTTTTTISTNPDGLEILVDGQRMTAPARLNWVSGSTHSIEAPVVQGEDGSRYLFGKWSDGGDRRHEVVASADTTWVEADFIVQHRVNTSVAPLESGSVSIIPHSPDGYYTVRSAVQAVATPTSNSGYSFLWWGGVNRARHGRNSNPATLVLDFPDKQFDAVFTDRPQFRIETGEAVVRVDIDDSWDYAPTVRFVDSGSSELRIGVAEILDSYYQGQLRYRFESWSDGGARSHAVKLPPQGGSIRATLAAEFPLSTSVADPSSGTISVDPPSSDGYYRKGTTVTLTAAPGPGWEFVGWTADVSALEPSAAVEMDGPRHVEAVFSRTRQIPLGTPEPVVLPSTSYRFEVHDRENGFRVSVPPGAAELSISFESTTAGAEVDLFVGAGSDVLRWSYEADGETPRFEAEARSTLPGSSEQIVLALDSEPPLESPEIYYIGLVVHSPHTRIEGTLRADVTKQAMPRPIPVASLRALTFVAPLGSDPVAQVIQLTNVGDAVWRYRIDSDQDWLAATPGLAAIPAGASAEASVRVGGSGLSPDTHNATLRLVPLDQADAVALATIEIPVTFVSVPAGPGFGATGTAAPTDRSAR